VVAVLLARARIGKPSGAGGVWGGLGWGGDMISGHPVFKTNRFCVSLTSLS